jgi:predicted lipoprotein with Yx(FWY)xxD motif
MAFVHRQLAFPRLLGALLGALALALAACGAASTASTATTATAASSVAATTASSLASSSTASAASVATSSAATTVQVRIDPALGTILVDGQGLTLYKYAKDGANASACLAACATAWPPLAATGALTLPAGVPGTLATFPRSDGVTQVSFNGVPLYRYAKDQRAGDVTGQGVGGVWSVANVANTRVAPATTATPATRVSGAIQAVANDKVTLQDGSSFAINSSTQVARVVAGTLSDLKPGDYVAITAKRQPDNSLLASMVNVFPPAAKGVANGQFPMTGGNLMTNATIDKVTNGGFTVAFPGGGATIALASDAKVTRSVAADQSALTAGTNISASVRDGIAQSITVQ